MYQESASIKIIQNTRYLRLQSLTEDILDVQKIESNTLQLNKENLDLNTLISDLVADYKKQLVNEKKEGISLATELSFSKPILKNYYVLKKISHILPKPRKYALDRVPTPEEIREILDATDIRGKPLTLLFLSSGIRDIFLSLDNFFLGFAIITVGPF
jgi:signal transduction histidine kinase